MIDNASFDQDGFLPVELLVSFTGLDKLCGVCPPFGISNGATIVSKSC